ncbi:MAG: T9SS type A sorting domain-containing protein [Sphingobacteriales bacterium]|nr:MAG: T9SS type A sorting domain-containing protein [Sphingobacteriales bacterium]
MRNTIFLISFLLFSIKLYSQIEQFTYFNKTFSNDSLNILAQVVRPNSFGYVMIGGYSSTSISNARYIAQLDQNGELIWIKNFVEGSEWNVIEDGKFVTETNDGNLVVAIGGIVNSAAKKIHLFKLDQNGNELWHREYENDTIKFIRHIIQTEDGGFALAGVIATQDTAKFLLIKADELGLWQWQRTYSMGNDSRAFSIQQTPWDGGYILGGWGYSTTTGYDMFVVKTLANGDTIWTKRYGGNENDCATFAIPITTYQEWLNGAVIEYLLSSCIYEGGVRKLYLAKIDEAGSIIWQKKHTFLPGISGLQVLPIIRQDKSFISSGYYRPDDFTPQPFIASFHTNGNLDWVVTPTLNPTKHVYIKDLQPTPDGGYVLAGYQYNDPQTAWVLKIDSLGNTCSYVGCDSTVVAEVLPGITSNSSPEISAMVYPVPASTYLNIRYQIPSGILPSGNAGWYLYDITGRQVAETTLTGNNGIEEISVAHLPAGIYYYRVLLPLSGQAVASGKILVSEK